MAKIFSTSLDVVDFIEEKFTQTGLFSYGINLQIMSVTKAKELIKIQKASATTEFLTQGNGSTLYVYVYESLFDRLDDESKNILVEMAFSNVSYDSEKDKISIDSLPFNQLFRMRKKYGDDVFDKLETCLIAMEQLEEEEKENKTR